jgi:hypothetical protein
MASCDLRSVLHNRDWWHSPTPFPHVSARNVFKNDFNNAIAAQVGDLIRLGLRGAPKKGRFSRTYPGYDVYGIELDETFSGPLFVFGSPD